MDRRHFITRSPLVGVVLSSLFTGSCNSGAQSSGRTSGTAGSFILDELSISQLQERLTRGSMSSRELVNLYLKRIAEIDQHGPALKSVIEVNPDAVSIATQLDAERKSGNYRGPLHGIPFLLKDNIDTGDKMMTTAGSLALSGHHARRDAPIVQQLRAAGAILLGKTNLSEWANFRSSRSSSGWSSRGGQTRNPYSLERNPCGSSSGSGVAVAANLCAFAIGTETNGSISCPSSVNGIVGLKPTVGLVSRTGIIPISKTQDTAGPMTRWVHDAALVLGVISGVDAQDEATAGRPAAMSLDYVEPLGVASLRGKRIGVEKSFLKIHEKIDALLHDAISAMKNAGASVVEVSYAEKLKDIGDDEYKLLKYEFKDGLNRYLENSGAAVRSLKELIAFNEANASSVMPFFGQEILLESEAMGSLDSEDYKKVRSNVVTTARQAIDGTIKEHNLDALCGPATGAAWCTDVVNGDSFSGYGMGSGAAMAGYPSVTVPFGEVHNLPVGLLFTASAFSERSLLQIAHAYEQVSRKRTPPSLRPSLL